MKQLTKFKICVVNAGTKALKVLKDNSGVIVFTIGGGIVGGIVDGVRGAIAGSALGFGLGECLKSMDNEQSKDPKDQGGYNIKE